jgi:ABC-type nitrate/sulfonate/bicarbonate transport system substrate-binding protein
VPVGNSSVELKDGIVDVLPVFTGNEPYVLKNQLNTPVDLILPDQFGYPPIGTSYLINANYAKTNREQITGFLRATLKACEFYLKNRDDAIQIAVQYAGPSTTREQHQFLYDVTSRDMQIGVAATKGVGYVTAAQWQAQLDLLSTLGIITAKPKVEDVLDTSFLDTVLKDGKLQWP